MSRSESELQGPAETGIIMVPIFVVGELMKSRPGTPLMLSEVYYLVN
jgi:hypothetical protein